MMTKIRYSGDRFPPEIIQQAIWLYVRFTLRFRDVEDLLAERGILVSYETVRRWVNHSDPRSQRTCADEGQSPIQLGIWTKVVGGKRHEHDILWQDELWRPCPQTAFGAGSRRQEFECIGGRG
jgi:hypothetical protein